MLGDLFNAGAKLIGGGAKVLGSAFGLASGTGGFTGGAELLNVAMNIFGGSKDNPWGMLDSPVTGHVLGAVGQELLRGDPVEERLKLESALDERRRQGIRKNYASTRQPPGSTAQKYLKPNGLAPTRGTYTPPR